MQYVSITASKAVKVNTRSIVQGFSFAAAGAALIVNIRDGSVAGEIVMQIKVAANDSKTVTFGDGVPFNNGVYVEVSSGTCTGSIFVE